MTTVGSVVGAVLIYLGARVTATRSKEAATQATAVDAQESAVQAWQGLNEPLMKRIDWLEKRMTEADARHDRDRKAAEVERQQFQREIVGLKRALTKVQDEVHTWQRLAKVIARWATKLRDEVIRLGGDLPTTPGELLLVQALEDDQDS
ncbi:MAG: hypothetical protein HOV78_11600 [Hamadaea sp.]|nr:hypothetical protein [Hamadaea sp.]